MDPDKNLEEQSTQADLILRLADSLGFPDDKETRESIIESAIKLAELVQSMDVWLATGGFLPKDWNPKKGE